MFLKSNKIHKISKIYCTLKKKFSLNENLIIYLKKKKVEKSDAVKMSYDVQSGSYIKFFNSLSNKKKKQVYYPLINILKNEFKNIKTVLDFGCGELTTSHYIFKSYKKNILKYFASDISLNRLLLGVQNLKKKISHEDYKKFKVFCNSSYNLPFKNNSIDIVITIHSLEANNKSKEKIIDELLRVSRLGLVLMEPHYEISSKKQKLRMKKFDYIRGIKNILNKKKGELKIIKKSNHLNSLNISSFFVFKKGKLKNEIDKFVEPVTLGNLKKIDNFLYSEKSLRLYPVFKDIIIFSDDSQIFIPSYFK